MEEELIGFETAKLAKEKGFNPKCSKGFSIDCHGGYMPFTTNNRFINSEETTGIHYASSTQSLLQKWLREKYGIIVQVECNYWDEENGWNSYSVTICLPENNNREYKSFYKTYEEALEAGLQKALKKIKR